MRLLALTALVVLASCSSGDSDEKGKAADKVPEAPAPASSLEAGAWEMSTKVTKSFVANRVLTDVNVKSRPMPTAPEDSTTTICIGADQTERPQETLFTGERQGCKYENFYMSRGRLVAALSCPQPNGEMNMSVDGDYTATSLDATVDTSIGVFGAGTLKVKSNITGRRTGACSTAPPA